MAVASFRREVGAGGAGHGAAFEEGEDGAQRGEAGGDAAEVDFGAGPEGDGGEVPGDVGGGRVEFVAGYEEDYGDGYDAVGVEGGGLVRLRLMCFWDVGGESGEWEGGGRLTRRRG